MSPVTTSETDATLREMENAPSLPLRCHRCGEVIGVYEPLIVDADGFFYETSRAAGNRPWPGGAQHYHGDCYVAELERPPAPPERVIGGS